MTVDDGAYNSVTCTLHVNTRLWAHRQKTKADRTQRWRLTVLDIWWPGDGWSADGEEDFVSGLI